MLSLCLIPRQDYNFVKILNSIVRPKISIFNIADNRQYWNSVNTFSTMLMENVSINLHI